jgi:DNA-binding NarL/FixJ family response regulator
MEAKQIRVVIVDDHKMLRETWKMILQMDNRIQVIKDCDSGEEAVDCALNLHPDVMLMDINMAPMNGFEATEKIASINPDIKIIGISINNQPTYVRHLIQLGAKGYVTKNSSKEEMIEAILEVTKGNTFFCKDVDDKLGDS